MVGQLLISGTPNLNLVFEDETGIVVCHNWQGKNVIHSELYDAPTKDSLKKAKEISEAIDTAFKTRGFNTLYTWAETEEQKRYNLFLGYSPTGEKVNSTFQDKEYPREVFEYKKELT